MAHNGYGRGEGIAKFWSSTENSWRVYLGCLNSSLGHSGLNWYAVLTQFHDGLDFRCKLVQNVQ